MTETTEAPKTATHWEVFLTAFSVLGVVQAAGIALLFSEPHSLRPYAFQPAANPDLTGPYVSNDELTRSRLIPLRVPEEGLLDRVRYRGLAPESIVQGPDGWLYTGLCDAGLDGGAAAPAACRADGETMGWVVRFRPRGAQQVQRYVATGGRPLGLAFDASGRLYIADAMKGLLRVESAAPRCSALTPEQEVQASFHRVVRVATCSRDDSHPDPFPDYADSVDVAPNGKVWFTCPSQRFPLAEIRNDGLESQPTGRVLRYEPCSAPDPLKCPKEVAADGLIFANGIAHLRDQNALLVAEWGRYRIDRLELDQNDRVSERRVFFDNTPGYPDNITVGDDGTVWVGLVIRRNPVVDRLRPYPLLEGALARLPESLVHFTRHAFVIGLDQHGKLLHNLQDSTGMYNQATGAYPLGNALYVSSNTEPAVACITRPGANPPSDPCSSFAPRATESLDAGASATVGDAAPKGL